MNIKIKSKSSFKNIKNTRSKLIHLKFNSLTTNIQMFIKCIIINPNIINPKSIFFR